MLPVKNLKVLKSINPDFKKLADYSNSLGVIGVHAFTLEQKIALLLLLQETLDQQQELMKKVQQVLLMEH